MGKLFKKFIGLTLGLAVAFGFINGLNNKNHIVNAADSTTSYQLITSTDDLEIGKSYVITNGISGKCLAMGIDSSTNNRKTASITVENNKFIRGASVLSLTLGGDTNGWTFATENYGGTAGYLNATNTTGSNYLKVVKAIDNYAYFSISFDSNAAVITCTGKASRNLMRYNSNDKLFSCYNSGQSPIYLFKEINTTPSIKFEDEFLYKHVSVGDSFQYKVKTENIGDAQVTFSSDNEDAATINPTTGVVNCLSVNVVNITASVVVGGETYSVTTELWIFYGEPEVYKDVSIKDIIESTEYNSRAFELEVTIKGWGIDGTDASPNDYGDMLVTDGENDIPIYGLSCIPTDLVWDGQFCNYTTSRRDSFNSAPPCNLLTIGSVVPVKGFKVNMGPYQALSCVLIGTPTINELSSISITPIEGKKYYIGDSVSPEDFVASVTHSLTGNESISSNDCVISPESFTASGENVPVTVSYTDRSGTISNTYYVSVEQKDIDIEIFVLNKNELELKTSDNPVQLNIDAYPTNHNETFAWISSDSSVASVDENGFVTPLSEGFTTITVTSSRTKLSDTCEVAVFYSAKYSKNYVDVITVGVLGVGSGSYLNNYFENVGCSSNALYEGNALKNTTNALEADQGCIQLNADKGAIWTATSGGTFKSINVDFSNDPGEGKELTVYGSNLPFETLGNYGTNAICSLSKDGTAYATEEYKYIYIRTYSATYIENITITWEDNYIATSDDMNELFGFVNDFLGISVAGEYDPINNKGVGNCISEGWYIDAKEMFNDFLTDDQRMLFMFDDYFANPRARLEAWALANNDSYDSETNKIDQMQMLSKNNFVTFNEDSDLTMIILLMMSSSALLGLFVIYKKKKEQ